MPPSSSLLRASNEALDFSRREGIVESLERVHEKRKEWLRRLIVKGDRIDLLAKEILGYDIHPRAHLPIIRHQFRHKTSLVLGPRGGGKSTIGTVVKCVGILCKNRNAKILLLSKTATNAEGMLRDVKGHLESNEKLVDLFGRFMPQKSSDLAWSNTEIEVEGIRLSGDRITPTVMCIGVGGALPSKHFDYILADDLVDKDNSATPLQRERMWAWITHVMMPTLNPPTESNGFAGEIHYIGTRYHYLDLYGKLQEGDCKDSTLIIPALAQYDPLDPDPEQSFYPERFSSEFLKKKRESMGVIAFNAQMQNNTEAMKGKIFDYDDLLDAQEKDVPEKGVVVMACDLASKQASDADYFSISVVKITLEKEPRIFSLYSLITRMSAMKQAEKIVDVFQEYKPMRLGIEANGYQLVQVELVKKEAARRGLSINIVPIYTELDKEQRAHNLTPLTESKRIFFLPGQEMLKEQLVLMPDGEHDDGFDSLDMAINLGLRRRKKKIRENEPDFT